MRQSCNDSSQHVVIQSVEFLFLSLAYCLTSSRGGGTSRFLTKTLAGWRVISEMQKTFGSLPQAWTRLYGSVGKMTTPLLAPHRTLCGRVGVRRQFLRDQITFVIFASRPLCRTTFNGSSRLGACMALPGQGIAPANCALGKTTVDRDDYCGEELTRNPFFPA